MLERDTERGSLASLSARPILQNSAIYRKSPPVLSYSGLFLF